MRPHRALALLGRTASTQPERQAFRPRIPADCPGPRAEPCRTGCHSRSRRSVTEAQADAPQSQAHYGIDVTLNVTRKLEIGSYP
jgi:hypothetical protein